MKKLGNGWQYNAYDLNNDRVLKKQKTLISSFFTVAFYKMYLFMRGPRYVYKRAKKVLDYTQTSIKQIRQILNQELKGKLGNPEFINDTDFTQDKVIPLEKYFQTHTLEENKKIVDKYIELIFIFWKYGFGDTPFKITINFGVDKRGEVILFDLGELYFDKEKAKERIASRDWHKNYIENKDLAKYYVEKMDAEFTLENLEKYWNTSSKV